MKQFSSFGVHVYIVFLYIPGTSMSGVLLVVMNFSLCFSAEKTENSEIAAQQILACVCVRVCMPKGKNNIRVACCAACLRPGNAYWEHFLRAYFKPGTIPTSSCDFWLGGGGEHLDLVKWLHLIIEFVHFMLGRTASSSVMYLSVSFGGYIVTVSMDGSTRFHLDGSAALGLLQYRCVLKHYWWNTHYIYSLYIY